MTDIYPCPQCEGAGCDSYGTCWTCGGTGLVDEDGFMAHETHDDEGLTDAR